MKASVYNISRGDNNAPILRPVFSERNFSFVAECLDAIRASVDNKGTFLICIDDSRVVIAANGHPQSEVV